MAKFDEKSARKKLQQFASPEQGSEWIFYKAATGEETKSAVQSLVTSAVRDLQAEARGGAAGRTKNRQLRKQRANTWQQNLQQYLLNAMSAGYERSIRAHVTWWFRALDTLSWTQKVRPSRATALRYAYSLRLRRRQ
jgi:hypothetical protein